MGKESRVAKGRKCKSCGKTFRFSSAILQTHTKMCKRMKDINLMLAESDDRERIIRV